MRNMPCGGRFLSKSHKRKKSTTYSGANLTTVSVCGGVCYGLSILRGMQLCVAAFMALLTS